jgi:hypothetical protein
VGQVDLGWVREGFHAGLGTGAMESLGAHSLAALWSPAGPSFSPLTGLFSAVALVGDPGASKTFLSSGGLQEEASFNESQTLRPGVC